MATNEQKRRASGAAMEQARRQSGRQSGSNMEQSRRAGGQAMIERRTGQSDAVDINALVYPPRQRQTLSPIEPRGPIPAQRGRGSYQAPAGSTTGAGIASPLTEKTVIVGGVTSPDREYWPNGQASNDGLLVIPAIKTLNLLDASGAAVQIKLAESPA